MRDEGERMADNEGVERSFLFIVGSGRPDGNTEALARIAAGAPAAALDSPG